ncbi:MAG: hypothetical protein QF546_00740 [Alphaproteobacteria bacterium]|nr:hypothetical protein [Alphaproteobacteria bacterium]
MKERAAIELAKNYPFDAPEGDFLFRDGEVLPYAEIATPCVPVIAFGSNAAPEHLARKFADLPGTTIPVLEIELHDLDIVYSAHLTRYASIPATLAPSPGTVVRCHLTLVPEERLGRLHESELGRTLEATTNYSFGRLEQTRARRPDGSAVSGLHAYLCNHGVCGFDETPIALSARWAEGRRFAAASEADVLEAARQHLAPELALDDFIRTALGDAHQRAAWTHALRGTALAAMVPGFKSLAP